MFIIESIRRRRVERAEAERWSMESVGTMERHKGKEAVLTVARDLVEKGDNTVVVTEERGLRNIITLYYGMELGGTSRYPQWQSKQLRVDAGRQPDDIDVHYGYGWRSVLSRFIFGGYSFIPDVQAQQEAAYKAIPIETKIQMAMEAQTYGTTDYRYGNIGPGVLKRRFWRFPYRAKVIFSSDPHVRVDRRAAA